jgi:hypothetical protein
MRTTTEVSMEILRDNFPVDALERCARRLLAIAEFHRSGVGGSQEPKHLICSAVTETLLLRDVLRKSDTHQITRKSDTHQITSRSQTPTKWKSDTHQIHSSSSEVRHPPNPFELVSTKAMPSGIILSTYKVAGPLKTA